MVLVKQTALVFLGLATLLALAVLATIQGCFFGYLCLTMALHIDYLWTAPLWALVLEVFHFVVFLYVFPGFFLEAKDNKFVSPLNSLAGYLAAEQLFLADQFPDIPSRTLFLVIIGIWLAGEVVGLFVPDY